MPETLALGDRSAEGGNSRPVLRPARAASGHVHKRLWHVGFNRIGGEVNEALAR
jgi:hypothetical protein